MKFLWVLFVLPISAFSQSISSIQVIDTDTQKVAATFSPQGNLNLDRSKLPKNFNFNFVVSNPSNVSFVRSQMSFPGQMNKQREDGSNYQKDDKKPPFALGSEDNGVFGKIKMEKDSYQIALTISDKKNKRTTTAVSISFSGQTKNTSGLGPLKIFPFADNFPGSDGVAGRGGIICKVNRLEDDLNPGSLRHCVSQKVPRIVVFEVSGTIKLLSTLVIGYPFITIAGQTAPAPGITLYGNTVRIQTKEVLVQHLSIRLGDKAGQRDVVEIFYYSDKDKVSSKPMCDREAVENIVLDHVALSWGIDGTFDLQALGCEGKIKNVSIVDSFISEHLNKSIHGEGPHSFASLAAHGSRNIGYFRNIFAHNMARSPRIDSNVTAQVVNNFMYNVGWHGVEVRNASSLGSLPSTINIIGNAQGESQTPINSKGAAALIGIQSRKGFIKNSIYTADNLPVKNLYYNLAPNKKPAGEPLLAISELFSTVPVLPINNLSILPASKVRKYVLELAGPRPNNRDLINERFITDIANDEGSIIDAPDASEVKYLEGMSAKPAARLNFPDVKDPAVADKSGWTNLDRVLFEHAVKVSE